MLIRTILEHPHDVAKRSARRVVREGLSRPRRIDSFKTMHRVPMKQFPLIAALIKQDLLYTEKVARHVKLPGLLKRGDEKSRERHENHRETAREEPAPSVKCDPGDRDRQINADGHKTLRKWFLVPPRHSERRCTQCSHRNEKQHVPAASPCILRLPEESHCGE